MKKFLSVLLVFTLIFAMVACSGSTQENSSKTDDTITNSESKGNTNSQDEPNDSLAQEEEDPFLTGEKPELNILTWYQAYNYEEQPSYKVVEDITGYKINWFNLPQENADEKLLLEIAGGTSYDLITRMGYNLANQLYVQNALLDLRPYLDKYGENILASISDMALEAVTGEDGILYAIPQAAFDDPAPGMDPYGALKGGIGFNTTYMKELGLEIPTTIDGLYNVLKTYTEETGKPALTQTASGWNNYILAGFGMGDAGWYEVDGEYVPRIKHPGIVGYLAFMQKLYKEGLLDNDFPVNTNTTAKEKFSNGTALALPVMFWDIDGIYSAFEAAGLDAKVEVATYLAPDENTAPSIYIDQGIVNTTFIPKTAKNPEHAIIWFNMISEPENFKRIYLGEEGVSYEVKDGNYYPIFPAFNDYTNSDKFTGVLPAGKTFKMWQARARKTEAMAEMYEQMNSRIGEYDIYFYYESYAASLEAVQNNQMALDTLVNDSLIQAIVSGEDPQTAINNIIKEWEQTGGLEYEEAMKTWYEENKANFQ